MYQYFTKIKYMERRMQMYSVMYLTFQDIFIFANNSYNPSWACALVCQVFAQWNYYFFAFIFEVSIGR